MKQVSPKPGDRVSEYVLEEKIGAGGFGEVWKAAHTHLPGAVVAIKIPTEPAFIENMKREGKILARVRGPHVVDVRGLDPFSEPPYLVMEYVDGKNLRQLIEDAGKVPPEDAAALFRQALEGLKSAHDQGVIHRDVKPENILLDADGNVKITDFGLGRAAEATASAVLLSGAVSAASGRGIAGTLRYMSPEQREGGPVDARTDLYSLGVVLFEMLTGEAPQGAELPSDVAESLPAWCDQVFSRCYTRLEKRFRNADEAIAVLDSLTGATGPASPAELAVKPYADRPMPVPLHQERRSKRRPLWMWPFLAIWAVFDGIGRAARDLARSSGGGGAAAAAIGVLAAASIVGVVVLTSGRKDAHKAENRQAAAVTAETLEQACKAMISAWKRPDLREVWERLSEEAKSRIADEDGWDMKSADWRNQGWRILEGIMIRYPKGSPPAVLSGLDRASASALELTRHDSQWYSVNTGDSAMEWVFEQGAWKMARSGPRGAKR